MTAVVKNLWANTTFYKQVVFGITESRQVFPIHLPPRATIDSTFSPPYTPVMEVKPRKLRNYVAPDGSEPFEEWLESLNDKSIRARSDTQIDRMRDGNFGDSEPLGNGLFELKLHFGSGYRVYYGKAEKIVVILVCGGIKRTQNKDIKIAEGYWAEFKSRK